MQGPKPGSGAVMWTGALGLGLGLPGLGLGPRRQVGLELSELGMGWTEAVRAGVIKAQTFWAGVVRAIWLGFKDRGWGW